MGLNIEEKLKKPHHGNTLRHLRNGLGLTQKTFGEMINIPQSTISELENVDIIADEKLIPFANFYGIKLDVLKKFNFTDAATYFDMHGNTITASENSTEVMSQNHTQEISIYNDKSDVVIKENEKRINEIKEIHSKELSLKDEEIKLLREKCEFFNQQAEFWKNKADGK